MKKTITLLILCQILIFGTASLCIATTPIENDVAIKREISSDKLAKEDLKEEDARLLKSAEADFNAKRFYEETLNELVKGLLAGYSGTVQDKEFPQLVNQMSEDFKNSRYEAGIEKCNLLVTKYPDLWIAHYWMSMAYLVKGDIEKASEEIDRILELKPGFALVKIIKIGIYLKQSEFNRAQKCVEEILIEYLSLPNCR